MACRMVAWLIGKPYDREALPPITRAFEDYKQSHQGALPNVPFQMLTALDLNSGDWAQIACNGSWQQVRQNLNTFLRHEVFAKSKNIKMVAEKLRDETAIARARVLPYQLLTAYQATSNQMPSEIREALQDAMETAVKTYRQSKAKSWFARTSPALCTARLQAIAAAQPAKPAASTSPHSCPPPCCAPTRKPA